MGRLPSPGCREPSRAQRASNAPAAGEPRGRENTLQNKPARANTGWCWWDAGSVPLAEKQRRPVQWLMA